MNEVKEALDMLTEAFGPIALPRDAAFLAKHLEEGFPEMFASAGDQRATTWYHGHLEDGSDAKPNVSEDSARWCAREYGGYVFEGYPRVLEGPK